MPPMTTFDAAAAEMVGDFVGALRGGGHRGDANQIGVLVQVQRLNLFVQDRHLPIGRRERRHLEQAQARAGGS